MKNTVLGNVLAHCKPPSLINRREELPVSGFSPAKSRNGWFSAGIQILSQRLSAANRLFRWKTVGVTKEYAKERLRTAADFRVVTPTLLHRWKQLQRGRGTRYCKFNHGEM